MFQALENFEMDKTKDGGFTIDYCDVSEMVTLDLFLYSYTLLIWICVALAIMRRFSCFNDIYHYSR